MNDQHSQDLIFRIRKEMEALNKLMPGSTYPTSYEKLRSWTAQIHEDRNGKKVAEEQRKASVTPRAVRSYQSRRRFLWTKSLRFI